MEEKKKLRLLSGNCMKGESYRAITACNDFIRLGPARTVSKLFETYNDESVSAPTRSRNTLRDWQQRYDWTERAAQYDERIEKIKTKQSEAALSSGLACAFERVNELKALYWDVKKHIFDTLTTDDGQAIEVNGTPLVRVNTRVVNQARGILDDIAKETGGRVQKIAPTTPDGKESVQISTIVVNFPDDQAIR